MRVLRSVWVSLVNFTLIFLPLVLLVVFVVQFGQPLVELYREYFLGNPAQELARTTKTLREKSGNDVPFNQLDRQFNGVRTMETISDTENQQVQRSVVRIHGAVVDRLGSGDLLAVVDSYSDSYGRLLSHDMVDQVFNRPDLVRRKLMDDLKRIRKLPKLPSHPVEGLDAFWGNSDTVTAIVEDYGSIYANQVACQQVFTVSCGVVYDESVELSSEYLSQYLSNWPEFSSNLSDRIRVFDDRALGLVKNYFRFVNKIEGYFQAEPWSRYKSFLNTFNRYKKSYRTNLTDWYETVMENFSLSAQDFSERQWSKDFSVLESLRGVERALQNNSRFREIVLSKSNRNLRDNVLKRLENLYVEVKALDQFESGFSSSRGGLQSLRRTIRSFPNGESRLDDQDQKLTQARETFDAMQSAIEDKRYEDLLESLRTVGERFESGEESTLWNIMATKFLLASRDTITKPDWQPTRGEDHGHYRSIVKLYGSIGSTLGLKPLSEDWVDQTLVALKSRRFNQLKHNILTTVETFEETDVEPVIKLLKEVQRIKDLPSELDSRSEAILFEVAVLEQLRLETSTVFETFSERLETRNRYQKAWTEVTDLISTMESNSASEFLADHQLEDYVSRWGKWLEANTNGTQFDELILKYSRDRVVSFVDHLVDRFQAAVRRSSDREPTLKILLRDYRNISKGLGLVEKLPGLEKSYDLEPWQNIILVRQDFKSIKNSIDDLKKGGLWSDNETFSQYNNRLENFTWRAFPVEYKARREGELLRSINDTVQNKAIAVSDASKDDWLPGWGGRVRGPDILNPWISFLERLNKQTDHPEIASLATTLRKASESTLRDLEE